MSNGNVKLLNMWK